MEEVDKIIIDSLRLLNCDIDEEITNLKGFNPDIVAAAVAICLEAINPELKLSKKLPESMSTRIKFASNLAQQIKDLGFKGDMGYQTILYYNEVEVRRVLMFLIERLPKDSSPTSNLEVTGYVPKIVKQIEDSLRDSLNTMWLPTEFLHLGTRPTYNEPIINSFGNSCPLDNVNLCVPNDSESASYIPRVTLQCTTKQIIPSLLFQDVNFSASSKWKHIVSNASLATNIPIEILEDTQESPIKVEITNDKTKHDKELVGVSKKDIMLNNLRQKKDELISLQQVTGDYEQKLIKLKSQREEEQAVLKDSIAKVKVKNKTLAVLNSEENKVKLKNLIQKGENRLVELANQWNEVQAQLLEEHTTLKNSISSENLKHQDEQNKLRNLRKSYKEMVKDFKEKSTLEQNLIERCKALNNKNNRAAYTKRILEIVGNIQKQNKEIQKILADTRQVQKDINNLEGQVDRSFTLSDEIIFHDSKYDESARKAYKLLAALREECNGILQGVSDMGQAERELRNLEDQVEMEKSKGIRDKLEQVQRDLAEIKLEIQSLM